MPGESDANNGGGLDPAILSFGPAHSMLPQHGSGGAAAMLMANLGGGQHALSSSSDTDASTSYSSANSSGHDTNAYIRYARDTLLALRCSSLVRPRPRYIEDAIAARRSFCRAADLSAGASSPGGMGAAVGGVGGGGGATGGGAKRVVQMKTALTRGGGPAKPDGGTAAAAAAAGGADKQRRVISASGTGESAKYFRFKINYISIYILY